MRRYQQVICQKCGEPLFVLPNNVYPAQSVLQPTNKDMEKKLRDDPDRAPASEQRDGGADGAADQTKTAPQGKKQKQSGSREKRGSGGELLAASERGNTAQEEAALDKLLGEDDRKPKLTIRRDWLREMLSPFRLVALAVVVMIVATVIVQRGQRRINEAEITIKEAPELAAAAVAEGDFATAAEEYGKAARAARILGKDEIYATELQRLRRESHLISSLASVSVVDIAVKAARTRKKDGDDSDWHTTAIKDSADKWLVFDGRVSYTADDWGQPVFDVEYPLAFRVSSRDPNLRIDVRVVGGEMELLNLTDQGQRVAFAARVESVDYEENDDDKSEYGAWVVSLLGKSVMLLTSQPHCEALGFPADDRELARVLERQAIAVGAKSAEPEPAGPKKNDDADDAKKQPPAEQKDEPEEVQFGSEGRDDG